MFSIDPAAGGGGGRYGILVMLKRVHYNTITKGNGTDPDTKRQRRVSVGDIFHVYRESLN